MMKRLVLFGYLLVACVLTVLASEAGVSNETVGVSVATFAGVTVLVSSLGTQIGKLVPYIAAHNWAKILLSIGIGIVIAMLSWGLQLADFMAGFVWWQALLTGVASGLSACGFYDLVKAVAGLFKKEEDAGAVE